MAEAQSQAPDGERRDFLQIATAAFGAVTVGAIAWPLIDQMNPDASTLALSSTEVDISGVAEGMAITVMWRGKPTFVRHRTAEEIAEAEAAQMADLPDPEADSDRIVDGRSEWLVTLGVCTHLGCVPIGNVPTENRGDYGGWFCPCHGSHYDTSGRIRKGPAPLNLPVPPYVFKDDTNIIIG